MLTKMKIPVIDTEHGNYEYEGKLSREEYSEMVLDRFWKTNNQMNRYVNELVSGVEHRYGVSEYRTQQEDNSPDIKYELYEAEVLLCNSKKKEVSDDFFYEKFDAKKMFLLILNINPNSMEGDAESEIRFWVDDSKKVHSDDALDDKMKLKILPKRSFIINLEDGKEAKLSGCKIIQDYASKKYPFNFAIIVENIDIK